LSALLRINGATHAVVVDARRSLLDVLRDELQLTGTKKVCDMGNCGACTVLSNGRPVYACLMLAVDCTDADITTIEGLGNGQRLDPVQQAFIDADAFQCGFCTPGQIMSVKGLLNADPQPSDAAIERALNGNLCRCGAYRNLLRAARMASGRDADTDAEHGEEPGGRGPD
jgi:aerobic-type carbon monoxide dehydrogenase small subunit (CoxS/CutS family)